MKNWKEVPVPAFIQSLPRDPRTKMPVPFVVMKDKKGAYHFKVNDGEKQAECFINSLCSICGHTLFPGQNWFIGGQQSAFHPAGAFIDSAMHEECAKYALQVCPYLGFRNYKAATDEQVNKQIKKIAGQEDYKFHNPTTDFTRLPFFVLLRSISYVVNNYTDGSHTILPRKPYSQVEFWNDGSQITKEQAKQILIDRDEKCFIP